MRVAIEARALSAASGGVKSYVRELSRRLVKNMDIDVELLVSSTIRDKDLLRVPQRLVTLNAEWQLPVWLQWQVPRSLEGSGVDLVHFTKADVSTAIKIPMVSTIYDVIPLLLPETQSFTRRYYWPGALRRAGAYSRHVFTISEASKRHLVERLDVDPDKITVTPLAVDGAHFYKRAETEVVNMRIKRGLRGPYVLFVGTRDKRKNVWALLKAWRILHKQFPHTLVLVGRQADRPDGSEDLVSAYGLEDRVEFWDDVSYEELPVIYSGADLFVWPSIIEGWGLPPQEALACEVPVIVSDGEPMREVVGDAGEIVPLNVTSLAEAFHNDDFANDLAERMSEVLGDKSRQLGMRERGLTWVQRFTWEAVAQATVGGYMKALQ